MACITSFFHISYYVHNEDILGFVLDRNVCEFVYDSRLEILH